MKTKYFFLSGLAMTALLIIGFNAQAAQAPLKEVKWPRVM